MTQQVNVLLLCRNSIVREGLSRILSEYEFNVSQSCSSSSALRPIESGSDQPTILLIDSGSEECDADAMLALQKRFPGAHAVLLTDSFDFRNMLKAFRVGMRGYIVKEISCDRLMGSLRLAAMGERVLPSQLADELQSRPALANSGEIERTANTASLSERELEILRWLIMGCPNKVISRHMDISEATVKVHVKGVLRKLGVKNRTQAAIWAANHGMRSRCDDVEETETVLPASLPAHIASLASTPGQLLNA